MRLTIGVNIFGTIPDHRGRLCVLYIFLFAMRMGGSWYISDGNYIGILRKASFKSLRVRFLGACLQYNFLWILPRIRSRLGRVSIVHPSNLRKGRTALQEVIQLI